MSDTNKTNSLQLPNANKTNDMPPPATPAIPTIEVPKLEVENKKEKTMAEFLALMDNYAPIIPDAVTDYYLNKSGFDCDDVRMLLALATQKFVADIATDAFQYSKDRKTVLTMEDLTAALSEYGVNVKKPDYYS
ncbi:hypothetical protein MFLAVUS_008593 [Mucor flavus]|uniref:Transcription initiation factor TFIID subunit 10 n=1 Tax=Mucor flavus TaxID=439312 RepID=A0ABP9Z7K8_9FUNG